MFKCVDGYHYMYEDMKCWNQLHILHAVVGIISALVFVVIYFVVSLCFFESKLSSVDPSARANSRNEFWSIVFKTICNLLVALFIDNDYRWVCIVVFAIGGIVLYIKQKNERPYYNEVINIVADVNNGLFLWSTLMLIIVMIAENTEFNGGIQAFLSGLPLVIIFLVTKGDHRKEMLLKGLENYDNGDQWYIKVRYYISFIQSKDMSRDTSVELKGFIYNHEEKCSVKNCPLKIYVSNITSLINDSKRKKQSKTAAENFALLMRFANALFLQGIGKFPACTCLRIAYAFFLKERMNNRTLAINELLSAEKNHPFFDEQFMIFRYRKLIEDEMADVQIDTQGGALDAISMIAYDNYLKKFKEAVEKSALLHMEFWLEVLEMEPDLGKLDKTGSKIHISISLVEDFWDKLQKINPNTPKALKMYAEFLIEILNDAEAGGELLSRAKDTVIARTTVNLNSLDATELMGMGDMCAGLGGSDGTPCVIASGEQGKLGDMIQFNMAICRLFGYTKAELNGRKISTLMPDMYAKAHEKILQRSLNNNDDTTGLAKNDIFVLGKQKSGYLLPLILQTRIITSITQGILFVGTFKPDKKGLNACYLLLNEQQDVVGVSSRAITILKLTNRLLKSSRVSFQTLAPSIQDKSLMSQYNPSNSGALLEFFLPETSSEEDNEVQPSQVQKVDYNEIAQHTDSPTKKLRVRASKESLKFSCIISDVILLNELAGYLVRLGQPEDGKEPSYDQKLERVHKYPNIQFIFDPIGMRFVQEDYAEDAQKRIAEETSTYVNIMRDRSTSEITPDKSDENRSPDVSMLSGVDEITRLQNALLKGKTYGDGIKTMRLFNGEEIYIEAKPRLLEKQLEEAQEQEEAKRKESHEDKKEDIFQSSLKSKKAFNAALNEKSVPSSIKQLKITGYVIVLMIITLAAIEFGIVLSQLKDIKDNIDMIKYSRRRIVTQMKMTFYINKLVIMGTNIGDYEGTKGIIADSLDDYYSLQSYITLSKLSLSSENSALYSEKCVSLYYRGTSDEQRTVKNYTLTEAVQQLASEVFTVHSLTAVTDYTLKNDDIDFILYNAFADLYDKMSRSADLFVMELKDRGDKKKIILYILYAIELAACIASVIFLLPVVSSVSRTRLEVLGLFLDIPQNSVYILEKKAEKFISKSNEEIVDDMMSNEGEILANNSLVVDGAEVADSNRTGRHRRKFKNNNTSNTTFYLQYIFAILVIMAYFSFNFAYGYIFLNRVSRYSRELDSITGIDAETSTSYTIYQQLIGTSRGLLMINKATRNYDTFQHLSNNMIPLMYSTASEVQNSHNDNQRSFKKDYQNTFIEIMRNDLCQFSSQFNFSFTPCNSFLDGTIVEGLHPVIINYIEQLREKLTQFKTINSTVYDDTDPIRDSLLKNTTIYDQLINSLDMKNMELTIFEAIDRSIQYLVDALSQSYSDQYDGEVTKRIIIFICFLVVLVIAFVAVWTPFTNKLNDEVE